VVTDQLRDPNFRPRRQYWTCIWSAPARLALWAAGLLVLVVPLGALYAPLLERYASKLALLGS
jgi:hypothetical protein